eukprot:NODE_10608_length_435_cov_3.777202_g9497_i0.p3 GENE.NODE_10608_length_435_cov_3.777202_g9497_i0~~NODE_10608_length_435_cov_3.777202_g9497_i0.p3  ORF type:complete len:57 (+),score=4.35 NODE_10608_length_435_cov_3.777202_g9497_i0:119-289(+)
MMAGPKGDGLRPAAGAPHLQTGLRPVPCFGPVQNRAQGEALLPPLLAQGWQKGLAL